MLTYNHSQNLAHTQKYFHIGLISILILNIALFSIFKKFEKQSRVIHVNTGILDVIKIPATIQEKPKIAPRPPSILIASENEELPEMEVDIFWGTPDDHIDLPPAPLDFSGNDFNIFVPYDQPPQIIGGYPSIAKNLVYPKLAAQLGIQGTVVIRAIISKNGKVLKTQIYQSMGNTSCDLAAQAAVQKTKWIPAKQRDEPVQVVMSIPIQFRLAN